MNIVLLVISRLYHQKSALPVEHVFFLDGLWFASKVAILLIGGLQKRCPDPKFLKPYYRALNNYRYYLGGSLL